jgi:hypothetical protein
MPALPGSNLTRHADNTTPARPWLDFPIITNHARTCRGPPHLACQTTPSPTEPRLACRAPSCLDTPDQTGPNSASPAMQKETRRACGGSPCQDKTMLDETSLAPPASPHPFRLDWSRPVTPRLACQTLTGRPDRTLSCLIPSRLACLLTSLTALPRSQLSRAR